MYSCQDNQSGYHHLHDFDKDSDASDDGELDTIIANEIRREGGGPSSLIPLPDPLSAKQTLLECESKDQTSRLERLKNRHGNNQHEKEVTLMRDMVEAIRESARNNHERHHHMMAFLERMAKEKQ